MSKWTISRPHPTKINLFIRDGVWIAKHGLDEATAPMRVERDSKGVVDMGKFDALKALCAEHPNLWEAGYVVLDP